MQRKYTYKTGIFSEFFLKFFLIILFSGFWKCILLRFRGSRKKNFAPAGRDASLRTPQPSFLWGVRARENDFFVRFQIDSEVTLFFFFCPTPLTHVIFSSNLSDYEWNHGGWSRLEKSLQKIISPLISVKYQSLIL